MNSKPRIYGSENGERFAVTRYRDAASFFAAYKSADIVFMDIDMPGLNGMDAAKLLREKDNDVIIIFVTNMMQMAIKGYEVRAFDFIVKPVVYKNFSVKLKRSEIEYIEVIQHILVYHTVHGEYRATGTLSTLQKELAQEPFALCNRCFFVNLAFVTAMRNDGDVIVAGKPLAVSRAKRAPFLSALNNYIAMNGE